MLTLIRNAEVYAPQHLGVQKLLVAGERIAAVAPEVDLGGSLLEEVDARGCWLLPGFVDALTHPCGGGGEGGFGNRTSEVGVADFLRGGVTSPVGALGTDCILRSLEVLFGSVMALRERGLNALMYTGAYRVPAPTLTGDIARDLSLLAPVIGVGELAIADHRSSAPSAAELRRIATETQLGGTLAGRGGTVLLHVGEGGGRLSLLREALESSDLPARAFYPTHCNRNSRLLAEAVAHTVAGGYLDITVSTTPELIAAGDLPALAALREALEGGASPERVTFSSDAGGSLPLYVDGRLEGLTAAMPSVMLELLLQAAREAPDLMPVVCAALTRNPAAALGLGDRGSLACGQSADLLLIDPREGVLKAVMCRGQWLLRDGELSGPASGTP